MSDRDEIRDELSGWPIGGGYYSTQVGNDDASDMADALLKSDWLAARDARVKAEALEDIAKDPTGLMMLGRGDLHPSVTVAELTARAAEYRKEITE